MAAAMSVASRTAVQACQDPAYGEDVAPDRAARAACRVTDRAAAVLEDRLACHLRHAFGYAVAGRETAEPVGTPKPVRLVA